MHHITTTSLPATARQTSSQPTSSQLHPDLKFALKCYVHSWIQQQAAPRDPSLSRFSFDTYRLVRGLERHGFRRGQAVSLMRTINALLVDATLTIRSEMLTKTELENQSYKMRSELHELRSELSLLRQNDTSTLKSLSEQLMVDIESLTQKFNESATTLKTEINLDMNNRKAEARETASDADMQIQEIHHKLILKLADLKTHIEATKMKTTRTVVWWAIGSFAIIMGLDWVLPTAAL
ncbi:hypothetical protein SmJEL517_g01099 [Synchytrium microbalum]|uniref:DUF1640 domain-containing protein n=1 Tax=Synchytrium microbalum TaxID=1806994 RepID=A0A507CD30_9FUNG|nr:uncharacterized protein SmJEL517_g01099 [Synchytrium microbalum]TPX37079.1 hypothetical protein SmJEL517_g01099 [Synchytrium microbalum]